MTRALAVFVLLLAAAPDAESQVPRNFQLPSLTGLESVAVIAPPAPAGANFGALLDALRRELESAQLEISSAGAAAIVGWSHLRLAYDVTEHTVHGSRVFVSVVKLALVQSVRWSWTAVGSGDGGFATTWDASRTAVHPTREEAVAALPRQVESLGAEFADSVRGAHEHPVYTFTVGPEGGRCIAEKVTLPRGRTPKPACGEEP